MILVGSLLTAGGAAALARRDETGGLLRFSYLTLAAVALPGFIIMRAGVGLRRSRRGGGENLLRASGIIALVLLALYVVAVRAMAGKPS